MDKVVDAKTQWAKEIREVFGPNSVMYEAMELSEIVEDRGGMTEGNFVQHRLRIERLILVERMGISKQETQEHITAIKIRYLAYQENKEKNHGSL